MNHASFPFITLLIGIFFLSSCTEQKPPPAPLTYSGETPRVQDPLSPEASMTHIQLPDGFEVKLFAAEPNIINPIAFTWDERGRLWVVQSHDYPHELSNEVGGDRITICEDTNGDGKADKFTDFATEQSLTTGITLVKGGAIVSQAPDMVFLEDTNGDDKMDKRTVLFSGFGTWDTHAGPSNLKYGLDNMIWGAVGYSGFENSFQGKPVNFKMGVYRFTKDGSYFEPVGQFNNNTWGLGFNENFEVFGSTANNNHCCFVGIPLKHFDYLEKMPSWAINADFIQGHYEISPVDTIPLQQVDVRGGYTAAAGANFYTARNYPAEYQNQIYVCEPTGHLVHIARIEQDGAGYKEVDGGNIFASTDAWTAPVFTETGPDGNLWVADWYNPVIQHNPDKRGMENQIWNTDKGEGNAHINPLRDYSHGRIYIVTHNRSKDSGIASLDPDDDQALLDALINDNMFWRTTAQRLIVEAKKVELIPQLIELANNDLEGNKMNSGAVHALWTLDGLEAFQGSHPETNGVLQKALNSDSYAVLRAALALLSLTPESSDNLAESGLLSNPDARVRLAALLKAEELPESAALYSSIENLARDEANLSDKWINTALKIYFKEENEEIDVETGRVEKVKPDASFIINTVNQEMAYDKTTLYATAGQTIEIVLNNKDQMPHNLVVIQSGILETFGEMVDAFLTNPEAEELGYIPRSRYVLGKSDMLEPGATGSVVFKLPNTPGIYPYVCTFPGHWRMMQGQIVVTAPGSYISENKNALRITSVGGGGSHDFLKYFGMADGEVLSQSGQNTVIYTGNPVELGALLPTTDVLFLSNNKPFDYETKRALFNQVNEGQLNLLLYHPSTWYNWADWPEFNKTLVGGGSRSHEPLQEFEVEVIKPDHPLMKDVPAKFRIVDELYRWEKDPDAEIQVLAIGRGLESGDEFPAVWIVRHPKAKIVANTLGHDERAHGHKAYQTILKNSIEWVK